ncbi:MAG: cation transporter [Clostridia bacterium]|nr:cation transporter [Clostridia bacterium]
MKCDFRIKGLDCANCAAELERAINKVKGVDKATISFMSEKMTIELDEDKKDSIMKDVEKVIKKEEPDVTIKEV